MNKVARILSCIAFAFAFCFLSIGYAAVQDTLTVSGSLSIEAQNEPFAVYGSIYDSNGQFVENALNFYNRPIVQKNDLIPLGEGWQKVKDVYTGFDSLTYADETAPLWSSNQDKANIVSVAVIDEGIQPIDMSYWFYDFTSCISFDLAKLDTSEVRGDGFNNGGMDYVFYNCSSVVTLDILFSDVEKVTSFMHMFDGCSNLKTLDISSFNTKFVNSIEHMFSNCGELTTIYAGDGFNVLTQWLNRYEPVFVGCNNLIGGNGTPFDPSKITAEYAHIDYALVNGAPLPGYFTYRGAECETHIFWYIDNGDGTHSKTCSVCKITETKNHNFQTYGECEACGAPCTHPELEGGVCQICGHQYYTYDPMEIYSPGEDDGEEAFEDFYSDYSFEITSSSGVDNEIYFTTTNYNDSYSTIILDAYSTYPADENEMILRMFSGVKDIDGKLVYLQYELGDTLELREIHRIRLNGYQKGDGDLTVKAQMAAGGYTSDMPVVVVISYVNSAAEGELITMTHIALEAQVGDDGKIEFTLPEKISEVMPENPEEVILKDLAKAMTEGIVLFSVVNGLAPNSN